MMLSQELSAKSQRDEMFIDRESADTRSPFMDDGRFAPIGTQNIVSISIYNISSGTLPQDLEAVGTLRT
jgi:hypothetical protein